MKTVYVVLEIGGGGCRITGYSIVGVYTTVEAKQKAMFNDNRYIVLESEMYE